MSSYGLLLGLSTVEEYFALPLACRAEVSADSARAGLARMVERGWVATWPEQDVPLSAERPPRMRYRVTDGGLVAMADIQARLDRLAGAAAAGLHRPGGLA